jgi:hypothetical protein
MNGATAVIQSIVPEAPQTWQGRCFITFDIDWACDAVLEDTMALVADADAAATWFVTHHTGLLRSLSSNPKWELGIHPNFNPLLDGTARTGLNAGKVISDLMDIVPTAKSVRSHSMTQSSRLLDKFLSAGLTHDVNHFIPSGCNVTMKPWRHWNGLLRVPYIWEDDVHCAYSGSQQPEPEPSSVVSCTAGGLKVFGFHPIHVYLNTECLDRYERTRPFHCDPIELIKHRYKGYGTRNRLLELLVTLRTNSADAPHIKVITDAGN